MLVTGLDHMVAHARAIGSPIITDDDMHESVSANPASREASSTPASPIPQPRAGVAAACEGEGGR